MRFENPIFLWLLCALPLLLLIRFYLWRHQQTLMRRLGEWSLLKKLIPDRSGRRQLTKFIFLLSAMACLIIALARPQMGSKISKDKRQGIEVMICLDISNSMRATDVSPSRLEKSKLLVENLVDHFQNDRIGLVVFAGDAFVQLPITADHVSAKMFLDSVDPSLITTQGTDIAAAIKLSANTFSQNKPIGKAIVLITDGEDHEGGAAEAARDAHKKGINVYILGVGTNTGAPVPDGAGGYLTSQEGQTVVSSLNEDMCKDVAQAGKGTYIHVTNTSAAQQSINHELTRLEQGEIDSVIYSEYDEQYQTFIILALILLLTDASILNVKNPHLQRINILRRKKKADNEK